MPDFKDRTDLRRVRGVADSEIDYSDIPRLDDPVWTKREEPGPRFHVHRVGGAWVVHKFGGAGKLSVAGHFKTQSEAISCARAKARRQKAELVVHSSTGAVRSYQNFAA